MTDPGPKPGVACGDTNVERNAVSHVQCFTWGNWGRLSSLSFDISAMACNRRPQSTAGTARAVGQRMNDFDRKPGAIDDPGTKGGIEPEDETLPPGDTAGNTGGPGEPAAAELDLPGPDDPVAWSYVEADTLVVGPNGEELGRVSEMLGTETEGIFHGIAVTPYQDGTTRVVPADAVTMLTSAKIEIAYDAEQLMAAEKHRPIEAD